MKKLNYYDLSLIILILVVGWLIYRFNLLQNRVAEKEKQIYSLQDQLNRADSTFTNLVDSLEIYRNKK